MNSIIKSISPLDVWLSSDDYEYSQNPKCISVTTLIRSPRYIIGTLRERFIDTLSDDLKQDFYTAANLLPAIGEADDPMKKVPSRIGTAIHSAIEKAVVNNLPNFIRAVDLNLNEEQVEDLISRIVINPKPSKIKEENICIYTENRVKKKIKGFEITGAYDAVIDGVLHDVKSTSTYSYTSGNMREKYKLQGSIYRWLNPKIITENTMYVNFIFTDWGKINKDKEGYPPSKVLLEPIELYSIEETENYIKNKLSILEKHWDLPLAEIPCCTDAELYSQPVVYKYYKSGYTEGARSTRNFSSLAEASIFMTKNGNAGEIIEHKGTPFKCNFCDIVDINSMIKNIKPTTFEIE